MIMHAGIRMTIFGLAVSLISLSPPAVAATDTGVLTAGYSSWGLSCIDYIPAMLVGYYPVVTGSYSPTGLTGGKTVAGVYDVVDWCGDSPALLIVSGFSSNPGSSWLTSATCNGLSSSVVSYIYQNGTGFWQFSRQFGIANGYTYSCSIVHN